MTQRSRPFRLTVRLDSHAGVSLEEARLALLGRAWADSAGGELTLCLPPAAGERQRAALLEELRWLGVAWDHEAHGGPRGPEPPRDLLESLVESGAAHPCACEEPSEGVCPCARKAGGVRLPKGSALKLRRPGGPVRFTDRVAGALSISPARLAGLPLVARGGHPSPLLSEFLALWASDASHLLRARPAREGAALHLLCHASGLKVPEMAHLPALEVVPAEIAPDLGALRQAGFLPQVLREALLAAGLRPGLKAKGAPARGSYGARARVTLERLRGLNRRAVRELEPASLAEATAPGLVAAGLLPPDWAEDERLERFARAVALYLRGRVTLLSEAAEALAPVFRYDPEALGAEAQAVLEEPEAATALCAFAEKVEASNLREAGAYPRIAKQLAGRLGMSLARFERYLAAALIGRPCAADLRALLPLFSEGCALDLPAGVAGPVERAWDAYYRLALPQSR